MSQETFGVPRVQDVLSYRKIAIAVVSSYLDLDEAFIDAVLDDQMDEFLEVQAANRARLKTENYAAYLLLLSRETMVRYAATAAEGLVASPESPLANRRIMGDTGVLGLCDDLNALMRVEELFACLEAPESSEESEQILLQAMRQMCNYYSACAYELVKSKLLDIIIAAAEEYYHRDTMSARRVREITLAFLPGKTD